MGGKIAQLLIAIFAIILVLGAVATINPSFINRPALIIVLPITLKVSSPNPIQDMDFHSLSRRDLWTLCKKNRIHVRVLQPVEVVGVIKEAQQFQYPMKAEVRSPNLPRRCRRTLAGGAVVPEEPEELQATLQAARRASQGAQAAMAGKEKQEETSRRTRQSTRKQIEETALDAVADVGWRTTRWTATQGTENSTPMGKNLDNEAGGRQISELVPEEESKKQEDHVSSGPKESPIKGLFATLGSYHKDESSAEGAVGWNTGGRLEEDPKETDGAGLLTQVNDMARPKGAVYEPTIVVGRPANKVRRMYA